MFLGSVNLRQPKKCFIFAYCFPIFSSLIGWLISSSLLDEYWGWTEIASAFICQYFGKISIFGNTLAGFLFLAIFWRDFYIWPYFGGISIFGHILAGFLYLAIFYAGFLYLFIGRLLDSNDAQSVLPSPPLARKLLFAGFLFLARRGAGHWASRKDIFRRKPQGSRWMGGRWEATLPSTRQQREVGIWAGEISNSQGEKFLTDNGPLMRAASPASIAWQIQAVVLLEAAKFPGSDQLKF